MNLMALVLLALMLAGGGAFILLLNDRQSRVVERRVMELTHGITTAPVGNIALSSLGGARQVRGKSVSAMVRIFGIVPDVKGMNIVPWQVVLALAVPAGYGAYLLSAFLVGLTYALPIGILAAFGFARGVYSWQTGRYRRKLYNQLSEVIELLVSAVSAGLPITSAFNQIVNQMPKPTCEEFAIVMADLGVGKPIDDAMLQIFERTKVPEYAFLSVTVGLQSEIGGGISESIQNLAQIIRDRRTIAERAEARASEAKLSGNVLAVMPPIFGGVMSLIHPGYLDVFVTDPSARKLLVAAVLLLGFGIILMRMIIRWSIKD